MLQLFVSFLLTLFGFGRIATWAISCCGVFAKEKLFLACHSYELIDVVSDCEAQLDLFAVVLFPALEVAFTIAFDTTHELSLFVSQEVSWLVTRHYSFISTSLMAIVLSI